MADDPVRAQLEALGSFIRAQRRQAQLSLRDLAATANISNPYLSQIERGLHQPSVRVLKSIAMSLDLSVETLLARAGFLSDSPGEDGRGRRPPDTETAILADPDLSDEQRASLLAVYRSYTAAQRA
jgi:transcriptional regulator with XRE-family HTH domain